MQFDKLLDSVGLEVAVSGWLQVPQSLIDAFAELTGDKNPIHLIVENARSAGFERPIAHGYLLIALIPQLLEQCLEFPQEGTLINRGIEWKFLATVLSGDSVRVRLRVLNGKRLQGTTVVNIGITMEILSMGAVVGKGTTTFAHCTQKVSP